MWPRRIWFLGIAILSLGLLLTAGFVGASAAHAATPTATQPSSSCPLHYSPVAVSFVDACPVPTGPSIDICSILTGGLTSCPIHEPDLNPADWIGWLYCTVISTPGLIWQAVSGFVFSAIDTAIGAFAQTVESGINAAVESLVVVPITWLVAAFGTAVNDNLVLVTQLMATLSQELNALLGPAAPIGAVAIFGGAIVLVAVGTYYITLLAWMTGKTLFNLL